MRPFLPEGCRLDKWEDCRRGRLFSGHGLKLPEEEEGQRDMMWTDDPVRDEMRWQAWLEEQRKHRDDDDYDPWRDERDEEEGRDDL